MIEAVFPDVVKDTAGPGGPGGAGVPRGRIEDPSARAGLLADGAAISEEARELYLRETGDTERVGATEEAGEGFGEDGESGATGETARGEPAVGTERRESTDDTERGGPASPGEEDLSPEERQEVDRMEARDRQVRAHEAAHAAAGGAHVRGGPSFEFEVGPDGRSYAVGGSVSLDVSPERDPRATIAKMRQIRRAALAPADPSGTDRAVAARAASEEARARRRMTG